MKAIKFFLILFFFGLPFLLQAEDKFKYDPKQKRDPFAPLIGPAGEYLTPFGDVKAIGDMKLEGIIWDPNGESYVIINGEIVKEGDYLGGVLVSKVNPKEVIILLEGQEFSLILIEEEGGGGERGEKTKDENQ